MTLKKEDGNIFELDNLKKIYICITDFFFNDNYYNYKNSFQFINDIDYYDITYKDSFLFNLKFNNTKEKRFLSFKIDIEKTNFKYLHFQINNNNSNNIVENNEFKNYYTENINYENYCINLTNKTNKIIFMKLGISSKEYIDNFDILLYQTNYYLFHTFNKNNKVEMPFIKPSSIYIFSNISNLYGYNYTINIEQKEIIYYIYKNEKKTFNENDINLNNLNSKKVKTHKKEDGYNWFTIDNEKGNNDNKIIIMKININNYCDFIISRDIYKYEEHGNNKKK